MIRIASLLLGIFLSSSAFAEEGAVRITMTTSMGDIGIDLYAGKAPVTVENFLRLVDGGHLDGGEFYRVVSYANDQGLPQIEVIQGGRGDTEPPFPPIDHETTEQSGILHKDGVISMARGDVGTATTEFFICIGDQPGLDYGQPRMPDEQGFAAFGVVVSGMDVVKKINASPADAATEIDYFKGQILSEPVEIIRLQRAN
jgi:peptidyl-prolyl cis-trans isomerase A (cyclophilin A)